MDRRHFLAASGLAAATPILASTSASAAFGVYPAGISKRVDFTSDGLGLNPREYATLLHEITSTQAYESDYYSNGGVIAELEQKFARLLGKQAAMFVPTGTLANHLAIRKLAGNDRRVLCRRKVICITTAETVPKP